MSAGPLRVGVIGAGTMGHGIAHVAALAGHEVGLADATAALAAAGIDRIRRDLDAGVARGKVSPDARDAALARVRACDGIAEAAAGAAIVVEAVPERLDLKQAVLRSAAGAAPAGALLASNTSSLSITELQKDVPDPGRLVGLHFFNPVHLSPLVEVVRGGRTSEGAVEAALAFAHGLGKETIVVNDAPGFATSRLGVLLGLEAMRMLEEGVASAADIDRAMVLGYRHPMGPLRLTDLVGLDVRLAIAEYLHEQLGGERFRPPRILREKVAAGKLGRKTGEGFHVWPEEG